ncbi:MAG: hypothetical protein ACK41E_08735 [Deinococcales bacterium]
MKLSTQLVFLGALALITACGTSRPLDQGNANNMKVFAPSAVASATQFLRGAPVDLTGAVRFVQQSAAGNARLGEQLAKIPGGIAQAFSRPQASLGTQAAGADCGTKSIIDADGDGIPSFFDYTFDCIAASYKGAAASLTGRVILKDQDDNDPNSGYDADVKDLTFMYTDNASNSILLRIGYVARVRAAPSGKYRVSQDFKFFAEIDSNNDDGQTAPDFSTYEYAFNGELEYIPDPSSTASTRFAKGQLKFVAKFNFKVATANQNYISELTFKSGGLQVNFPLCGRDSMVSGGSVRFTDGLNTLTWNVTGCGDGTWDYQ